MPEIVHRLLDAESHGAHEVRDAIASEHLEVLGDAEQRRDVAPEKYEEVIVVRHCSFPVLGAHPVPVVVVPDEGEARRARDAPFREGCHSGRREIKARIRHYATSAACGRTRGATLAMHKDVRVSREAGRRTRLRAKRASSKRRESANGASLHRGPRLDPIGDALLQSRAGNDVQGCTNVAKAHGCAKRPKTARGPARALPGPELAARSATANAAERSERAERRERRAGDARPVTGRAPTPTAAERNRRRAIPGARPSPRSNRRSREANAARAQAWLARCASEAEHGRRERAKGRHGGARGARLAGPKAHASRVTRAVRSRIENGVRGARRSAHGAHRRRY